MGTFRIVCGTLSVICHGTFCEKSWRLKRVNLFVNWKAFISFSKHNKWVKVFKNGPSEICGRQPFKIWSDMVCLSRRFHFKFFKGCLLQIFEYGPFLNILTQIYSKNHFILMNVNVFSKRVIVRKSEC